MNDLNEIIHNDSKFLESKGLMDFSLLLFVETEESQSTRKRDISLNKTNENLDEMKPHASPVFTRTFTEEMLPAENFSMKKKKSHLIYHIGVIDYLQTWDYSKWGERILKTIQNKKSWT